jgi:hypothetical protein
MANEELLHKVLRHLKDNPTDYDAARWHRDFAGWTLRLALPGVEARTDSLDVERLFDADGEVIWIQDIGPWAMKLLGINVGQSVSLFSGANTLEDLERIVTAIAAGSESKPDNPSEPCRCKHPRYLHRPGWCRACECSAFTAAGAEVRA